jgi:hypothetical protein
MAPADENACERCGGPAEPGFVRWNDGYALRWQPRDGENRWRPREVLVRARRPWSLKTRTPATRCPTCRLVWFEY